MATEADLEFHLSGGTTNTSAALSLGGVMSRTAIKTQNGIIRDPIPGVRYRDGSLNPVGDGLLTYVASTRSLLWLPAGATVAPARPVIRSGRYVVRGPGAEFIVLDVTEPLLLDNDRESVVTISNPQNSLLDDIVGETGVVHRCEYLYNQHPTDPIADIKLRLIQPRTGGVFIGLDPSAIATTLDGETDVPPDVIFSKADIDVGSLNPRSGVAIWWRRESSGMAFDGDVTATLQAVF